MAAVKGSKQYRMVVVPYRPLYRVMLVTALVLAAALFGGFAYEYGKQQGAGPTGILREAAGAGTDEEFRRIIAAQRERLAWQDEKISFYRRVMLPGVADEGLRIERLDINAGAQGGIEYSLLLTRMADDHDYVTGDVRISLHGRQDGREKHLSLGELDAEKADPIRFHFRYFQTIDGNITLPEGFEPRQVAVVAESSGANARRLEKTFDWPLNGPREDQQQEISYVQEGRRY